MKGKNKSKKSRMEKFFILIHLFEKYIFRLIFPYKKHGNLTKYNKGPLILVGNHYSLMDMAYACQVTDRPIHFVAKDSLWKGGIVKWFVDMVECIPVKRDGTDVQAIKACMKILKSGGVINIYPEGTRNHSYRDLLPFRSGAAALSIKTQTPIIPVVQIKKMKLFRKRDIIYGDPIEFREFYGKKTTRADIENCDNRLREAIINMRQAFIDKYKIKFKSYEV